MTPVRICLSRHALQGAERVRDSSLALRVPSRLGGRGTACARHPAQTRRAALFRIVPGSAAVRVVFVGDCRAREHRRKLRLRGGGIAELFRSVRGRDSGSVRRVACVGLGFEDGVPRRVAGGRVGEAPGGGGRDGGRRRRGGLRTRQTGPLFVYSRFANRPRELSRVSRVSRHLDLATRIER